MNDPATVPSSRERAEPGGSAQRKSTSSEAKPDDFAAVPAPGDAENPAETDYGVDLGEEYEPL